MVENCHNLSNYLILARCKFRISPLSASKSIKAHKGCCKMLQKFEVFLFDAFSCGATFEFSLLNSWAYRWELRFRRSKYSMPVAFIQTQTPSVLH